MDALAVTEQERLFEDHLLKKSVLAEHMLSQAREVARETGSPLVSSLSKLGFIREHHLAELLAEFCSFPRLSAHHTAACEIDGLSIDFLRSHALVPVATEDDGIVVATVNPLDDTGLRGIAFAKRRSIKPVIATLSEIDRLLGVFDIERNDVAGSDNNRETLERLQDLTSDAPAIRMAQRLFATAIERRASDIHAEPTENGLKVRLRLDGVLQDVELLPSSLAGPIVSRIKVMAGLNIAERRLPQDGRLSVTINGKEVDFRVATSPTLHGESVVLRILDRQEVELDFLRLGFDAHDMAMMTAALRKPYGIILSTGPTGSGKTTTLYTALKAINGPDKKLLTVEDPIEYTLEGVNQTQVRPAIGYTFASALRAFLRQDPDVIMVGEIRDKETANIAIQAALTGHLLLSTLHTNSAAAAVARLLDMGIEDFLLTSTLNLVIGQRLLRRLCIHCRIATEPTVELAAHLLGSKCGFTGGEPIYRAAGCTECKGRGYAGRTGILEMMEISEPVRKAMLAHADATVLEREAVAGGMRTMYQRGLALVTHGQTSLEEVLRVTRAGE